MKKKIFFSCCISLVFVILFTNSFVFATEKTTDYESMIDDVADAYVGKSVPGACVIVSEHGEIVFSKAYGYADLEKNIPMDFENTVFEWGSISKTFIWVSVMQLVEEGKIDLEEDIRNYLPKGFLKNLHYDKPVTMLNLMNHTAGFEDEIVNIRYFEKERELSLVEVLSSHQPEQVFPPGEISAYSNWGAALAGLIVERVSGQNYKEYVNEHILKPLDMNSTSIGPFQDDNPSILEGKAVGYSFSKKKFKKEPSMYLRMYPAGGMNGSVGDLLKYSHELAKDYDKGSLLFDTPRTKKEMFTETYRSFGANAGLSHGFWQYACNSEMLGHEGGTYGFKTQMWMEPKNERTILILTNVMETEFCSKIMEKIAYKETTERKIKGDSELNMLNGDYCPARSASKNVGKIQGKIQMISIKKTNDNRLCLTMPFRDKKQYYEQINSNIFFCKEASPEEKILAFKIVDGKVESLSFRLAHDYIRATNTQGKIAFLFSLGTYISTTLFFLTLLIICIISILQRRKRCMRHHIYLYICGAMIGISGITGMAHWFSIYEILARELMIIVIVGWCFSIIGLLCGGYAVLKERSIKNSGLLLIFIAQIFSTYYLGFLTVV
ncbi:TPA: beta-lactamase family protein [Streptococcus agalactiae]|nr:beta-lactamase family protein [Streptococcus agalactiae]HEO2134377.1 beta-lactamase family protein [Streptococcus agalactiae]HEO2723052.1 beta-lactamase family protein [Streptococcus agalactiae]HEO3824236.1 beta-lactamase family protein [Streptococcus agalactiae]